jgi:hypothetical protein
MFAHSRADLLIKYEDQKKYIAYKEYSGTGRSPDKSDVDPA